MYVPAHFREDDTSVLHGIVRDNSFGLLVTAENGVPFASHLPFLLDSGRGACGTLRAHMARANPQLHHLQTEAEVVAIFEGPHGYISPAWYTAQPSVPTWNYVAVHAYGTLRILGDDDLGRLLEDLVRTHEAGLPEPWDYALPPEYLRKMTAAICGFEIEIIRLEGKLKLSQNRSAEDQQRVIAALNRSDEPGQVALARAMAETARRDEGRR